MTPAGLQPGADIIGSAKTVQGHETGDGLPQNHTTLTNRGFCVCHTQCARCVCANPQNECDVLLTPAPAFYSGQAQALVSFKSMAATEAVVLTIHQQHINLQNGTNGIHTGIGGQPRAHRGRGLHWRVGMAVVGMPNVVAGTHETLHGLVGVGSET